MTVAMSHSFIFSQAGIFVMEVRTLAASTLKPSGKAFQFIRYLVK
jgi:hypothetical protein